MLYARLGGLPGADRRVRAVLDAVSAGSVSAVGDLFDLFGGDVWLVAARLCEDPELAEQATVSVFLAVWESPDDVPRTYDAARHHLAARAGDAARRHVRAAAVRGEERRAR